MRGQSCSLLSRSHLNTTSVGSWIVFTGIDHCLAHAAVWTLKHLQCKVCGDGRFNGLFEGQEARRWGSSTSDRTKPPGDLWLGYKQWTFWSWQGASPVRVHKPLNTHGTGRKAPGFPLLSLFVPRWEEICISVFLAFVSAPEITGRKWSLRWLSLYSMVLNITLVWTRAHHLEKNIFSWLKHSCGGFTTIILGTWFQ